MEENHCNWYVIRTKPHKENIVKQIVESRNILALVPTTFSYKIIRGKKKKVFSLLISTYVFVQCLKSEVLKLEYIQGSIGVLKVNNIPVFLHSSDIERLNKLCQLNVPPEVCGIYKAGQQVVISNGILKGVEGVVVKDSDKQYLYIQSGIQDIVFKIDMLLNDIQIRK